MTELHVTSRGTWEVSVDRGGTFADIVATSDAGRVVVRKVPTDPPADEHRRLLAAIREIAGVEAGAVIPASAVRSLRFGTTVATNALLERRGEPTALLVTRGFADLLTIGMQDRPHLFALHVVRPPPLAERMIEIDERVLADGSIRRAIDENDVRRAAALLRSEGFRAVAVLFVHSHAFPEHEAIAGRVLRDAGFDRVSLSHEVAREIRAVPRGETTVADAYLTPPLRRSLEGLRSAFAPGVDVRFLQSHGGLADIRHATGPRAVLSGPAGGVLACVRYSSGWWTGDAVGFDMGGTSTDVARCPEKGGPELVYETRVGGMRLRVPSLAVTTVAAGGGSIVSLEGRQLRVGPESAGASPGPAGYGRGGPPTVTDANAVLGRLVPAWFPACFGEDGVSRFSATASRRAVGGVAAKALLSVEATALGAVRVANERMAQAIREVSLLRGHDLRDASLVAFGGAGGQHVCALAALLGMREAHVPRLASVFSAYGIGCATTGDERAASVLAPCDDGGIARAAAAARSLESAARAALDAQGVGPDRIDVALTAEIRHEGADAALAVPLGTRENTLAAFHEAHRRLYGFARTSAPVEIVSVRVRAAERAPPPRRGPADLRIPRPLPVPLAIVRVWFDEGGAPVEHPAPLFDVATLTSTFHGFRGEGPALLVDEVTTIVVEPGWAFITSEDGIWLRAEEGRRGPVVAAAADAVTTALFANRFMSLAERMGAVLERTSHSTNIKERLDFSCAVFDADGRLVANAPHIPVHLGAMGESVRAVVASRGRDLREGDVILTNDPYHGGSHLPDITAVTPVLVADGRARFFVANRAHHADIGGATPGSMPPLSTSIGDEGASVHDLLLVRDGVLFEDDARRAFAVSRAIDERIADFRAQAAANAEGARLLREMCEESGADVVAAYMGHVLDDGAAAMEEMLRTLPPGPHVMEDALDDGTPLRVSIAISNGRAVVDFAGTGPRSRGNLNAPRAVTRAAVLYALRCLVGRDVPLNEGCLRPVEIRIPAGSILDPQPPDAVVGGNVETSMRIVDLVLGALGACAASQGTMNNVTFGTSDRAYYETLGGGGGAGPAFDGASAIQLHMTNTRITDVEVLETRFPVVVRRFAIRRGSGGAGAHRGGDGMIREIEFLAPMDGGILSERRVRGAFGLAGGSRGAPGRNLLIRAGVETELAGRAAFEVRAGDVLRIETPGGGGYGRES